MGACISKITTGQIPHFKKKSDWENFQKASRKTSQLIVINFTTKWCEPCKDAEEHMQQLAREFPDVKFAKIDVDHLAEVAKEMKAEHMPTFVLVRREKEESKKGEYGKPAIEGKTGKEGTMDKDKEASSKNLSGFKEIGRVVGFHKKDSEEKFNLRKMIEDNRHVID